VDALAPDSVRLDRCPGCGYSLTGLPDDGTCPECGRGYDQQTVVLYGWGRGKHATIATATPWVTVGLLLVYSLGSWSTLTSPFAPTWQRVGVLVFWGGVVAFVVLRRQRTPDLPGLVQVHLSDIGCAQLDDPAAGAGRVTPWNTITDASVEELRPGRYRIRVYRKATWRQHFYNAEEPVDAEIECSGEQAEALRQRMEAWRQKGAELAAARDD
jgi:hypothetical protein